MRIEADSVDDYISQLAEERQVVFKQLRQIMNDKLPAGFEECLNYDMPSWVVPHSKYPAGYHVTPELPLPFISIGSQKRHIALYHSGIYTDPELHDWFVGEYPNHCQRKLDMGKSCIRFKKIDDIPYELIGTLATKITPDEWIALYENNLKDKRKKKK